MLITHKISNLFISSLLFVLFHLFRCTSYITLAAQQPSTLRAEIEKEKEIILEKKEKVIGAATDLLSKSKLDKIIKINREKVYKEGVFNSRVKNISEKLSEVAHGVSTSTKSLHNRQESLQSTLNQVTGDWKAKAASKKSVKTETTTGKPSSAASSNAVSKNASLNRLHQHLNK